MDRFLGVFFLNFLLLSGAALAQSSVDTIEVEFTEDLKSEIGAHRVQEVLAPEGLLGEEIDVMQNCRRKRLLIDFSASWCRYCRDSLPALSTLSQQVVATTETLMVLDDAKAAAEAFIADERYAEYFTFKTTLNKDDFIDKFFVTGYPTTVLLDADNKVVFYEAGALVEGSDKYETLLEEASKCDD